MIDLKTLVIFSFFIIVFVSETNGNTPRVPQTLASAKLRIPSSEVPPQPKQYTRNSTVVDGSGTLKGFEAYDYPQGRYYSHTTYLNGDGIFDFRWYLWNGKISKYYSATGKSIGTVEECSCTILNQRIPSEYTSYIDPNSTLEATHCETTDQRIGDGLWIHRNNTIVSAWCLKDNKLLEDIYVVSGKKLFTVTYFSYYYVTPSDRYFNLPIMCHAVLCK